MYGCVRGLIHGWRDMRFSIKDRGGFNSGFWTEKDGEDVGFSLNWQRSGIWRLWD